MTDPLQTPPAPPSSEGVDRALRQLQSLGISIPRVAEVRSYLTINEDLVQALSRAGRECHNRFDDQTELSLEVSRDPEVDERTLILFVRQHQYCRDIEEKIETIDEQYIPLLPGGNGYFLVMTDFQPPRR